MPAPILHLGATVLCTHAGQATPLAPFPRVLLSGQPVGDADEPLRGGRLRADRHAGAALRHRAVDRRGVAGARRRSAGRDDERKSVCVPTGTPMLPVVAQTRVLAT